MSALRALVKLPPPGGLVVRAEAGLCAGGDGLHLQSCSRLDEFIARLPKAELHLHVEGTLEPELMVALAKRNGVALPYVDAAAARSARQHYNNLEDFLATYYAGLAVLRRGEDYFDLADAYLARAAAEGVRHVEMFFDPQAHLSRGVPFAEFLPGLRRAVELAPQRHGLSAALIMCFLRDVGPAAAAEVLEQAEPYRDCIAGVGLDSAERGHPPHLFADVFRRSAQLGWHRVAHAGEEGGPEYVQSALDDLQVERIDHGIRCLEDSALVARLEASGLPLTLCPLSNLRLQVYSGCLEARLRQLVRDTRVVVTVNSDDPAYFGSYICGNYSYLARVAGLGERQLAELAAASFRASLCLEEGAKAAHIAAVWSTLEAWRSSGAAASCCRAAGAALGSTAVAAGALGGSARADPESWLELPGQP